MCFCVIMMPSENLVIQPREILCTIGYLKKKKKIKEGSKMSKGKNADSL